MEPRLLTITLALALLTASVRVGAASLDDADALAGPPPGGVTGKVMDAQGRPMPGVKVVLRLGESSTTALTDELGEYCFCRVKPGRNYVFELDREGFTGYIEREFTVAKARLAVRNVIIEPLKSNLTAPGDGTKP